MRYLGVDYHRRFSHLTTMDKKGKIIKEGRISNTKEALQNFLKGSTDGRVIGVLEAGRNWQVMYDLLEEELESVKLAHPYKVKAKARGKDQN